MGRLELMTALTESVKLQSHYAELLNMYDAGERMTFDSAERWIDRLREVGILLPWWWGYLHINETIQAKRYLWDGELNMKDAKESSHVAKVFGPFEANSRQEALEIIHEKIKG